MINKLQKLSSLQLLTGIVVLNLIISLPGLWVPFYNIDELTNAIQAKFINSGDLGLKDFLGSTYFFIFYMYSLVLHLFKNNTLLFMHVFHAMWQCMTAVAFYWVAKKMGNNKTGLWASLFYVVFSHGFMSKDYFTPSAESFSLLPAVLSVGFAFYESRKRMWLSWFLAGCFAAVATYFKAPMGVICIALGLYYLLEGTSGVKKAVVSGLGFCVVFVLPFFFVLPFGSGFTSFIDKISETGIYIQSYQQVSTLYWFVKLLLRTGIVFSVAMGMIVFSFYALKPVFMFNSVRFFYWRKIILLFVWLVLLWLTVALGKRVFYHYFVFLLGPLCLLAGIGLLQWDNRHVNQNKKIKFANWLRLVGFVRKYIFVFLFLPVFIFTIDAAFNISTMPPHVTKVIDYVKNNTKPEDKIYVWGNVPQIYFYSERQPSTAWFWSDILAGTSPGSPAMMFVSATKQGLNLKKMIVKDLKPSQFKPKDPHLFKPNHWLTGINEMELLTVEEILERINHPYWHKVIRDFIVNPPELFIDSSPTNICGFAYYPISKYELIKRFVSDNYVLERTVDGFKIYRLKS